MLKSPKENLKKYSIFLTQHLKQQGFKKHKNSYYLNQNKNWAVITLQKSRDSTSSKIKFTINAGIFSAELGDFFEEEINSKPNPNNLHWSKRIGRFLPESIEYWQEICSESNGEELAKNTIVMLEQYVIPKLILLLDDYELESLWLLDEDSQTTEFQRLLNLSVLFCKHRSNKYSQTIKELQEYSKKRRLSISYHLNKLNAEYKHD